MINRVILKSLRRPEEVIELSRWTSAAAAQASRKDWRRVLGGKHWTVDRRPGLDTLDDLALTTDCVAQ